MKTCPNSDPNFDAILTRFFKNDSPQFREKLFYYVCIWVRLALFSLILYFKDKWWIPIIVGGFSLFAIFSLSRNFIFNGVGGGNQWWSKTFQLIMAILVLLACTLVYFKKISNTCIIPILLFISLLGGLFQSIFIKFC